jgi:hypothetical protein
MSPTAVKVPRLVPVPLVAYSGASRTAFRGRPKGVRLRPGIPVRLQPGMLFGLPRNTPMARIAPRTRCSSPQTTRLSSRIRLGPFRALRILMRESTDMTPHREPCPRRSETLRRFPSRTACAPNAPENACEPWSRCVFPCSTALLPQAPRIACSRPVACSRRERPDSPRTG